MSKGSSKVDVRRVAWIHSCGPAVGIEPEPAAPAKSRAAARREVGLLEMLLLGAPDGKTELIEGKVLRQLNTRIPGEAHAVFKRLARERCEYSGIAWRKRFVANTSHFDLERAHLEVDGTTMRLYIDVPRAIWDAFE